MEALDNFPDGSLDFVYIDGNHSIRYATEDIYEWYRKVRPGGAISGHDYFVDNHNPYWIRACHVKYAVDMCVKIFGAKELIIMDKDKHPSWLWIKD
jgi:ubiquinone/menaquinone biosynthesis C-methylase UbiE